MYDLFSRLNPAGQLPEPHIWMTSLKFMLRHGHRKQEVIAALTRADRTEIGEAVLQSLEHAPKLALSLIRKGLLAKAVNPRDRRGVLVTLSPKGEAAVRAVSPFLRRVNDLLFRGVGRQDFAAVSRFLEGFAVNGERALDEIRRSERAGKRRKKQKK